MNPIIKFCKHLASEGLPITAVWAEPLAKNRYLVRASIPMMVPGAESGEQLLVAQKEVPCNVTCSEWHRYPDQTMAVCANDEQIEAMISDLAKYGDAQDYARFEDGKYLTKPNKWFPGIKKVKTEN